MPDRPRRQGRRAWLLALAGLLAAGCSPAEIRTDKPPDPTYERLLAVGTAYARFNLEKGRAPRGPDDLRGLLEADGLVSLRDGEPFAVCWGVDLRAVRAADPSRLVLAHEKRGRDGSRYVLNAMMFVGLLTDEELRSWTFPPGHGTP